MGGRERHKERERVRASERESEREEPKRKQKQWRRTPKLNLYAAKLNHYAAN